MKNKTANTSTKTDTNRLLVSGFFLARENKKIISSFFALVVMIVMCELKLPLDICSLIDEIRKCVAKIRQKQRNALKNG